MRELKKGSSAYVHREIGLEDFSWQKGYAAFTVSTGLKATVRQYIANQEEHHHRRTFREELIELLEEAGISYDPRYLD